MISRLSIGEEEARNTYVDGIDTGGVLPKEQSATEEETVEDLSVVDHGTERLPEPKTNCGTLMLQSRVDTSNFFHQVHVGGIELSEPAKVANTLLTLVLGK